MYCFSRRLRCRYIRVGNFTPFCFLSNLAEDKNAPRWDRHFKGFPSAVRDSCKKAPILMEKRVPRRWHVVVLCNFEDLLRPSSQKRLVGLMPILLLRGRKQLFWKNAEGAPPCDPKKAHTKNVGNADRCSDSAQPTSKAAKVQRDER